ncbi:phosphoglycerate mutase [Stella humosa]|uniref:2,3-bisphosphoglycerate-independent phosphoglycerate mutase n=1 Tax=Stella humosa TaxID=94 RepID=A0A3N1KYU5_9PROT|nr:2,3-bisphosphoglycerate-independent phosphoglycerate mutase [Stella humosa]ROP83366.1 phosphoglycerate mutase [Stella humosa]BBK29850.1 2,3-bisphosphoglycerate-independent phosphoglycerate mutase [Stella humosa]
MTPKRPKPVVLCILDGWGHRDGGADNALAQARLPNWRRLVAQCPHGLLDASAAEVGLPDGQMGNSEVGHMNIGAGRVVMQELPRITRALADGSAAASAPFQDFVAALKASGGTAHLVGLLSPGGVHSHQDHIAGLARLLDAAGIPVAIHALLDGRDTPPDSARSAVAAFQAAVSGCTRVKIATVMGRYYAMDRDQRWDRVSLAYATLIDGAGGRAADATAAIAASYAAGKTDEFVLPLAIGDYAGMRDGDGLLMANFRADRAREILSALLDPAFDGFARARRPQFAAALGMVEYSTDLNRFLATLFTADELHDTLGEIVSRAGMRQLRIAETEKYAHVTFFLNGGDEREFAGEERILVPSPKVATYDLQPEMSAAIVTDRLVEAIGSGRFDLIVVNFANADMVGHSGILAAAVAAVEAVDTCLGRLDAAVRQAGGVLLVTADHGNAEQMIDPETGGPHTAHSMNPVPIVMAGGPAAPRLAPPGGGHGRLSDIAPTILALMGLPQPAAMTGRSLLAPAAAAAPAA